MHLVALLSAIRSDNSNSVNNLQILYLSDSGLIACVCQGRGKCEGVLRVVAAGQLRVADGLHLQVRPRLRRPQDLHPVPQGLHALVPEGDQERGVLKSRADRSLFVLAS